MVNELARPALIYHWLLAIYHFTGRVPREYREA